MPTSDFAHSNPHGALPERREAEMRPKAMREAVEVGIADIAAGCYLTFDTAVELRADLSALVDEALRGADPSDDPT